jgi:hypothetical protein
MKKIPLFLLLLAAYPCISLYAHNIAEMSLVDVVRPLAVSWLVIGILFAVLLAFTRKVGQSAITVGMVFLVISSYGAFYNVARTWQVWGIAIGRHRTILPVIVILLSIGCWLLFKAKSGTVAEWTCGLNIFSVVLIAFPLFTLVTHTNQIRFPQRSATLPSGQSSTLASAYPDVYYFILDSYGRADYIDQYMKYDNTPFINSLTRNGFSVLDCGLSNYSYTRLSLATSLNMNYITELGDEFVPGELDETLLDPLIQNNQVMQAFQYRGYKTVALVTGYPFTELRNADYYFQPPEKMFTKPVMTEFEYMVIQNTLFSIVSKNEAFIKMFGLDFPYYQKWNTEHYIIEQMKQIPSIQGPKFVFIHLVTTHRPYIFRSDGSILNDLRYYKDDGVPVNDDYYIQGYQYGLDFTNEYMLELVDLIQSKSTVPPIIIIQGDHGVRQPGRLSILNAISFPGQSGLFSKTTTPVNTFRIILRTLFGESLENLPDQSYTSDVNIKPFDLIPADNQNSCQIQ